MPRLIGEGTYTCLRYWPFRLAQAMSPWVDEVASQVARGVLKDDWMLQGRLIAGKARGVWGPFLWRPGQQCMHCHYLKGSQPAIEPKEGEK